MSRQRRESTGEGDALPRIESTGGAGGEGLGGSGAEEVQRSADGSAARETESESESELRALESLSQLLAEEDKRLQEQESGIEHALSMLAAEEAVLRKRIRQREAVEKARLKRPKSRQATRRRLARKALKRPSSSSGRGTETMFLDRGFARGTKRR